MASEQAVSLIQQACERLQVTEVNSDGLRVAVKGAVTWVVRRTGFSETRVVQLGKQQYWVLV